MEEMQLFRTGRGSELNVDEFWRQTAEKRGGEIGLVTFATLLGRSGENILDMPGLLYTVGGDVWFEDFEKDNWMYRLMGGNRKYQKTELSFRKADVTYTRLVSRSTAFQSIHGGLAPEGTRPISPLGLFFSVPAMQIGFADHALFFEVMKRDDLLAFLKGQ